MVCVPHSCSALGLFSHFKPADNCRLGLWWEQVVLCRMSAGPPFVFGGFSLFIYFFQLELQFSTLTTRCHLAHKGAHGFKPDGDFIFRFGGSAVVYHGKMKWGKSK